MTTLSGRGGRLRAGVAPCDELADGALGDAGTGFESDGETSGDDAVDAVVEPHAAIAMIIAAAAAMSATERAVKPANRTRVRSVVTEPPDHAASRLCYSSAEWTMDRPAEGTSQ